MPRRRGPRSGLREYGVGLPYEGEVAPAAALETTKALLELGAYEVSLGDTIGVGNPLQTATILELFESSVGLERVAMHMHDTRGLALANCLVGLEYGVTTFDSSVAGVMLSVRARRVR